MRERHGAIGSVQSKATFKEARPLFAQHSKKPIGDQEVLPYEHIEIQELERRNRQNN
jgi:hypothetical protein